MSKRNENRPGFKKTKVGWIPEEWKIVHLKFLCPEKSGIKTGPFGSQLHASDYVESGIPVIMPTNMSNGRVEKKSIAMVSENTARRLKSQSCKNWDILFARRGELGRCALIKETEFPHRKSNGRIHPTKTSQNTNELCQVTLVIIQCECGREFPPFRHWKES